MFDRLQQYFSDGRSSGTEERRIRQGESKADGQNSLGSSKSELKIIAFIIVDFQSMLLSVSRDK